MIGGPGADITLSPTVSADKLLLSEIHFGAEMLCLIQLNKHRLSLYCAEVAIVQDIRMNYPQRQDNLKGETDK